MCVWSCTEGGGASAENLCLCSKFYMNFQTDDGFILFTHVNLPPTLSPADISDIYVSVQSCTLRG